MLALMSAGGDSENAISVSRTIVRDLRNFLLMDVKYSNRFQIYREAAKFDNTVALALSYVPMTVKNSYVGVSIDPKATKDGFRPTEGFLDNVNQILSEIQFTSKLEEIITSLLQDGIYVGRLHLRSKATVDDSGEVPSFKFEGRIDHMESLPIENVTLVDDETYSNKSDLLRSDWVIRKVDHILVNEGYDSKGKKVGAAPAGNKLNAEVHLFPKEVLIISYQNEHHAQIDQNNRTTFGIWGKSPIDSVMVFIKGKITSFIDFLRWQHNAAPRWHHQLLLKELLNPDNFGGDVEKAKEEATRIFQEHKRSLYYTDDDPNSITYKQSLKSEPDEAFVTTDDINIDFKGGTGSNIQVIDIFQLCDRQISNRFGVSLVLAGYEEGCLDKFSMLLTKEDGWIRGVDYGGQHIAIFGPAGEFKWEKPSRFTIYRHTGKMHHFRGRVIDQMVTPNHRMYLNPYTGTKTSRWEVTEARFIAHSQYEFKRDFDGWNGEETKNFILPGIVKLYNSHGKHHETPTEDIVIDMDTWLKFFGYYLTEGHLNKTDYTIKITQNEGSVLDDIISVCAGLPFNFNDYCAPSRKPTHEVQTCSKQLFSYLEQFGKARDKFIPDEIKALPRRQLSLLLDAMLAGDGCKRHGGYAYYSYSKRLLEDVSEIALKLGYAVTISYDSYCVQLSERMSTPIFKHKNMKIVDYDDEVFCPTVSSGLFLMMRNGRVSITGNSTYAVGKVSASFMSKMGNGLIRSIEDDLKKFLQNEFLYRGLQSNPDDWENMFLELETDDSEIVEATSLRKEKDAAILGSMASALSGLISGGIITADQAFDILQNGPEAIQKMKYTKPEAVKAAPAPQEQPITEGGGSNVPPAQNMGLKMPVISQNNGLLEKAHALEALHTALTTLEMAKDLGSMSGVEKELALGMQASLVSLAKDLQDQGEIPFEDVAEAYEQASIKFGVVPKKHNTTPIYMGEGRSVFRVDDDTGDWYFLRHSGKVVSLGYKMPDVSAWNVEKQFEKAFQKPDGMGDVAWDKAMIDLAKSVNVSEHYKCPTNTVKPGSCECPKDAEDVQLKARKAKDTGIQVRMVAENSYKPARTYTLNNISIDEFTMDESKQRYPIKDVSKVVTSMPDKISSTIKKIEVHEGPSPMTEEISKKLGVQATIDADAEYTTGKIRIWNGSLDSGDDVDGMKLLQENLPHEAAHLVDRMTLSQSPDYAAAVESDGGWATGYAKDTAELDLKAGYGEDFADSVSEWVTARRSKADMGSHRLANRFKYFEEVLGQ